MNVLAKIIVTLTDEGLQIKLHCPPGSLLAIGMLEAAKSQLLNGQPKSVEPGIVLANGSLEGK